MNVNEVLFLKIHIIDIDSFFIEYPYKYAIFYHLIELNLEIDECKSYQIGNNFDKY